MNIQVFCLIYRIAIMRLIKNLLILLFILIYCDSIAQSKDELKIQKQKILDEIDYTTNLLNNTKSNKIKSLDYLNVLTTQIQKKEQFLITLNLELSLLIKKISKTEKSISITINDIAQEEQLLKRLKDEYAKMIFAAFKQKDSRNDIVFIISATDFNQAYKRILYLKQYAKFRKNQTQRIQESTNKLKNKNISLVLQKENYIRESKTKKELSNLKFIELESINKSKEEKKLLVASLVKSEKQFKNEIKKNQIKAKRLDDKIRKIIEEEIARAKSKDLKNTNYSLTPEAEALSKEFSNNKGKLPWPLEKGVIISKYGTQKHSVFAGIETFNNGINIATDKNADVRVIFDGTVSRIFFIKGEGKAILINHGEYYSVYSGLKEVTVKAGEKVFSKEKIGVILTHEDDNKTQLHFEIWKGYEKSNPSIWLYNAY